MEIGLVTTDAALRAAVRQSARARVVVDFAGAPADVGPAELDQLLARPLQALILDLRVEPDLAIRLGEHLAAQPGVGAVVGIGDAMSAELLLDAIRAGFREFLPAPLSTAALDEALHRIASRASAEAASGRLSVFVGASGGAGATSLAVHTAGALAHGASAPVLLADLDSGRGDAELHLGLDPRFSMLDFVANLPRMDAPLLESMIEVHGSGLHFLRSPAEPTRLAAPDAHSLGAALTTLREHYAHLVADAPNPFTPEGAAVLAAADDVVLVVTQDMPAVRNAARLVSLLDSLGRAADDITLVVNREHARGLPPGEIGSYTGLAVAARVPAAPATFARALAEARLLQPRDGAAGRQIHALAARLSGVREAPPAPRWSMAGLLALAGLGNGVARGAVPAFGRSA